MNQAVVNRLRRAALEISVPLRERHIEALAALLHLLDHVMEGREPTCFVFGQGAAQSPELHWAAEQLGHPTAVCRDPECRDEFHVTVVTKPLTSA